VRADWMDHFVIRNDIGLHKAPYLGPASWVLIPVEVSGHPPLEEAQLQNFFSSQSPHGFSAYYRTVSLGRFQPEVTVLPTVHYASCPLPENQFPNCAVARGNFAAFDAGTAFLRDLIRRVDEDGADFSAFDLNGRNGGPDGFADGVMVVTNVPFAGIAFPIGYFNDADNLAGGTGGPLIVDGVKISHIAVAGEGSTSVLLHEAGHLLGLTDLYDESGKYAGLHLSLMGAWDYSQSVPLLDAETRYRLRWANVTQATGKRRFRIPPAEKSGEVIRVGTGEEYFLIENRGPGTYDANLRARGLAVYHVDRRVRLAGEEGTFIHRLLQCVNCDPWRPYIRIVQADGAATLALGGSFASVDHLFRDGDTLVPSPTGKAFSQQHPLQSSQLYSGEASAFSLRDVVVRSDDVIEVTVDAPATDTCADVLCSAGPACEAVNCKSYGGGLAGCGCSATDFGAAIPMGWFLLMVCGTGLRRRQGLRPSPPGRGFLRRLSERIRRS
jgi:M6 family metalloprotease-like protein